MIIHSQTPGFFNFDLNKLMKKKTFVLGFKKISVSLRLRTASMSILPGFGIINSCLTSFSYINEYRPIHFKKTS